MKTYVFKIEVEQDEEGIWEAEVPSLPGCATWGHTRAEALEALQPAGQAALVLEIQGEAGHDRPKSALRPCILQVDSTFDE